jgi:FkbM family methyltransferase
MAPIDLVKLVRRSVRSAVNRWLRYRRRRGPVKELSGGLRAQLISLHDLQIYVDVADQLVGRGIAAQGSYEPHLTAALRRLLKPGYTFVDIGANIGYHSLVAARLVGERGRVIAIEMSPSNCALLRANATANGLTNLVVHQTAVAERVMQLSFCLPEGTGNGFIADNCLDYVGARPAAFSAVLPVQAVTVDSLIPSDQRVDVIKIDIEGSEFRAFQGMKQLLRCQRPAILMEYFPEMLQHVGQTNPVDLLNFLRAHGYTLHEISMGQDDWTPPLSNDEIASRTAAPSALIELLALPARQ